MVDSDNLPKGKRTDLGLYVTAGEAYAKWCADPDGVKVLDVRTPEEYVFVGHPEMARNIPLGFVKHQWDTAKNQPAFTPNTAFLSAVQQAYETDDTILVICRSGGRSALAVNALAAAGFTIAYNITDGMEGDLVKDTDSAYCGKRMQNGWINSGSPWTYDVDPDLLWTASD